MFFRRMKKFQQAILAVTFFAVGGYSQTASLGPAELGRIELLKSSRGDVAREFQSASVGPWGTGIVENFGFEDWNVAVFYSTGVCAEGEDWDVPAGTVTD